MSVNSGSEFQAPFLMRYHVLDALHRDYGSVVRIGPNEVSVANWQQIRTIYANTRMVLKDSTFYANASLIGKSNIFQMVYEKTMICLN